MADTEEATSYGSSKKLKQKSTKELNTLARELERRMQEAAKALDFEAAAELRDQLIIVKGQLGQKLVPKKKKNKCRCGSLTFPVWRYIIYNIFYSNSVKRSSSLQYLTESRRLMRAGS